MSIITVCGSGRHKSALHKFCGILASKGFIVLAPPLHNIEGLTAESPHEGKLLAWKGATYAHFNRVATADVCVMFNPNGYLGVSSSLELGYAVAMHKLIIALQHDQELGREALFDIVLELEDEEEAANQIGQLLSQTTRTGWSNV